MEKLSALEDFLQLRVWLHSLLKHGAVLMGRGGDGWWVAARRDRRGGASRYGESRRRWGDGATVGGGVISALATTDSCKTSNLLLNSSYFLRVWTRCCSSRLLVLHNLKIGKFKKYWIAKRTSQCSQVWMDIPKSTEECCQNWIKVWLYVYWSI